VRIDGTLTSLLRNESLFGGYERCFARDGRIHGIQREAAIPLRRGRTEKSLSVPRADPKSDPVPAPS
jgi:hypothetical protein